jgi:potassium voltage-gated channel Shal-related subfamily D member 2
LNSGRSRTAISTVGYGEITPRSFLGRLITLPLLVFGLLLIALPSFVLGREFSIVWNEMASGPTPHTPYAHSGQSFAQSEPVSLVSSLARLGER